MTYPRYGEYKDSGLPWIGSIPSSWTLVPNRTVLRQKRKIVGGLSEAYVLLSLTNRGIIVRDVSENRGKFPASFDTYQDVAVGDIVFCLFDIEETPRTVALAPSAGMITGAYDVFAIDTAVAVPEYVEYLYLALDSRKSLSYFYSGLRKVIRMPVFKAIRMPLPPLAEQKAIVAFLDRETAKIDHLIGKQNTLIELLGYRRKAVITRAVTKGLDLDAPMKDSGVDWLGDVPWNWSVNRLKLSIKSCRNGIWGAEPTGGVEDIRCVRVADFDRQNLRIQDRNITYRSITMTERRHRTLRSGISCWRSPGVEISTLLDSSFCTIGRMQRFAPTLWRRWSLGPICILGSGPTFTTPSMRCALRCRRLSKRLGSKTSISRAILMSGPAIPTSSSRS